jgi:uncharacterized protein YoaH (UPF0181 family)
MCELTAERWKLWIDEVDKLTAEGMSAVKAFKEVAKKHKVSWATIKRAYYRPLDEGQTRMIMDEHPKMV